MKPAVFDYEDIHHRLSVLRGDASSGVVYEKGEDGKHSVAKALKPHNWGRLGVKCPACGVRRIDVDDFLVSAECGGVKFKSPFRARTVGNTEIWLHPDGSRFHYHPSGDLAHLNRFRHWKVNGSPQQQYGGSDKANSADASFQQALNYFLFGSSSGVPYPIPLTAAQAGQMMASVRQQEIEARHRQHVIAGSYLAMCQLLAGDYTNQVPGNKK